MTTRHIVKSCCGKKAIVFQTDKPIRKSQIQVFKDAGFLVPENYLNLGIFYVQKNFLIATASFGSNKINARCHGDKCSEQLDEFGNLLDIATNLSQTPT